MISLYDTRHTNNPPTVGADEDVGTRQRLPLDAAVPLHDAFPHKVGHRGGGGGGGGGEVSS